jgi:thymidylate synthase
VYHAAYTIVVVRPKDSHRPRGGPCLNYIALQLGRDSGSRTLSLLAVYRNHDFVQRALGNYIGLADLQAFLADQSGYGLGTLTCVSSRASLNGDGGPRGTWPSREELAEAAEVCLST